MITPETARMSFIRPALSRLGLYTLDAEKLLMGTAAVESNFINFIQFGGGPARGMFQMEEPTYHDLVNRVLGSKRHHKLREAVFSLSKNKTPSFLELTTNHMFSAAMARIKYYSIPKPIPSGLDDQAKYWSVYYNGVSPHGLRPSDYLHRWQKYCASIYAPLTVSAR